MDYYVYGMKLTNLCEINFLSHILHNTMKNVNINIKHVAGVGFKMADRQDGIHVGRWLLTVMKKYLDPKRTIEDWSN